LQSLAGIAACANNNSSDNSNQAELKKKSDMTEQTEK